MADGQTATNPQTGEKVILRGGQWVPLSGGAQRQTGDAPRGIRNNNPGNIEDGAFARSLPGYAGSDGRFARFDTPDAGAQAAPRLLQSYIQRGYNTPASIINRWAPPSDNNPTQQYAEYVARRVGVGLNDQVGPDQIPLLAQAISEFENGNTVSLTAGAAPQQPMQEVASFPQTATNPQTGEKMQLVDGQWQPMQPDARPSAGTTMASDIKDGVWVQDADGSDNWRYVSRERAEREADPEYQRAFAEAQNAAANVPDQLRALTLGGTLGFLTDINATAQGALQGLENAGRRVTGQEIEYGADMAAQAARDAMRDDQARYAAENPVENFALQAAGGLLTPGLSVAGNYISRGGAVAREAAIAGGATAQQAARVGNTARLGRASQVGAGQGLLTGLGYGEGNLIERAPGAALSTAVGAGAGVVGQSAVDRLTRGALNPRNTSAARRLSREGVELTPGQMVAEIPLVGPALRTLEEGASTIPLAGAAISGARDRSVTTFNRAAINRALAPIGEAMPTNLRAFTRPNAPEAGYEAVERAQGLVSRAYDRALEGVQAKPDPAFYDELAAVTLRLSEEAPEPIVAQFGNILQNRAFRNMEFADSPLNGQQFKRADSEIGALAREQRISNDPANRALARALDDTREVLRSLVARQNPEKAPQINAANQAFANLVRIQEAAGSTASQAAEGVFSPTQLGVAAARGQTRGARATNRPLMQDLASAGRGVLNSRLGDSGTATRGAVTALASGAAGAGTVVNPAVAIPTIVGVSALYSRPAQAALNAVYRATDSRAASEAVQELARLAQRDPALVPYYEGAVQHLLGLAQQDRPAAPPVQSTTPAPSAALQRVMQP